MGADLEELVARKQLLATRAALQRLQVSLEIHKLREKTRWARSVASVVTRWGGIAVMLLRLFRRAGRN